MPTDLMHYLILGLTQGVTEFLPISSSAHLIIFPWIMGWEEHSMAVDVSLHLATFFAIIFYFWNDWMKILREGFLSLAERTMAGPFERKLFWYMVIATIPAVLIALMFGSKIEECFRGPVPIALMLGFFGLILYFADAAGKKNKQISALSWPQSLLIGACQALAIMPGVSRSGVTMSAGLFLGLDRTAAARFSFLLSAPIILGAGIYEMKNIVSLGAGPLSMPFVVGFLAAFLSSIITIHFLLKFVKEHPFTAFAIYRLAFAAVLLALFALRGY